MEWLLQKNKNAIRKDPKVVLNFHNREKTEQQQKGTQVKIISGKDKGKSGEILEINRKLGKLKIKSIGMIKKHTKPTKENKGGIITLEGFIHLSNLKHLENKKETKKTKK